VVEVVELASTVVEVEAEVAVVIEEVPAVLRRDLLVPCPFGGLEYCGVGAPFGTNFTPTVWRPPRGRTHNCKARKRSEERGSKEISLIFNSFIS
jgi:hypothetical protein